MRQPLKWIVPLCVLVLAVSGGAALLATSPAVEVKAPEQIAIAVRVLDVRPEAVQLVVRSQGTIAPRTESALIPEVSGPVVWISPSLVSGGFFEVGELLLRIDPLDYEAKVARARANLARAESEYEHAEQNLSRRQRLSKSDISSASQLDDARRSERVAEAVLAEQRVALAQAERDRARTEIHAPFSGRVREEHVDLGQFVSRGASIGTIYATDVVEVRLPIPDSQLAYLDLQLWRHGTSAGPPVTLRARFGGADHSWQAHVARTEGEIDAKSRMVHVVAQVEKPYEPSPDGRPPLAVGLFVSAEIQGPRVSGITIVPRSAMRGDGRLMVVDADDRLWLRDVDVLRIDREDVLIRTPLAAGERVCVSPIQAIIPGMRVRVIPSAQADDVAVVREGRS